MLRLDCTGATLLGMSTQQVINDRLERLDLDRHWLARATGYQYDYVRNRLAPNSGEVPKKFAEACNRVLGEEESRTRATVKKGSVWENVFFSGAEVVVIDQARRAGGYRNLPDLYRDAVISFADEILERERVAATADEVGEAVLDEAGTVPGAGSARKGQHDGRR